MAVGKGSLKRVVANSKKDIVSLAGSSVVDVDLSTISFSEVQDSDVLASVKTYGVILPVVLEENSSALKVVDGAKRLTALKTLGAKTVKAVIISGDSAKICKELKKFEPKEKIVEKIVEKVIEVEKVAPKKKAKKQEKVDLHEEKFNVIKRLGEEEMPYYLL
ncbi:MAG: ParB-like nuclease domain-containing protein [Clostridia bacterium]|nr:ParB-like nuclease domain-containing protein [Clostridia bacterium]